MLDRRLGHDLADQPYRVVVTYTAPDGTPQELTSDFRPQERVGFVTGAWRFVQHHAVPLVALLALLLLGAVTTLLLRRQRRLQAELAQARRG